MPAEWGRSRYKAADEELERLQPLELPLINMTQWKKDHPSWRFLHRPSDGVIIAETGATIVLEVLGHAVKVLAPVGWLHIAYQVITLSARDHEAGQAQLEAWNTYMSQAFWNNEKAFPAAGLREAEFDRLAGDNRNHGITPTLTPEAQLKKEQLIAEINGRWLANAETMLEAKKFQEQHAGDAEKIKEWHRTQEAEARRNAELYVLMDPARSERERARAEFLAEGAKSVHVSPAERWSQSWVNSYNADVKAVMAIETNPSNWNLTPEQKGTLNNLTSPGTSAGSR